MRFLLFALLSICISLSIQAFNKSECFVFNDTIKRDTISKKVNIDQIVITAQHSPKKIEDVVQNVKIIDRKSIEAKNITNLSELLAKESSMRITQDNALGTSVSMQGISGQNIKILIDGSPVIGRLNGFVDISQISLNDIEKIEIIEGPLSVEYGTDALAGTINLISKSSNKKTRILNSYFESIGRYNLDFFISENIKNGSVSLSSGRNYFDGWTKYDPITILPTQTLADSSRKKSWKPKEQIFLKIQQKYKSEGIKIVNRFNTFYENILDRGYPRMPYQENAFDQNYITKRTNYSSNLTWKVNTKLSLKLLNTYSLYERNKTKKYIDLTTLESLLTQNISDHDTTKFKLIKSTNEILYEIAPDFDIRLGYDFIFELTSGRRILSNKKSQSEYAFFLSSEIKKKKLIIRPAIRAAYNTNYNAPVIPSINTRLSLGDYTIRKSISKGFRSPSLKEIYLEFIDINHNIVGNNELESEESMNYQFSISRNFKLNGNKMSMRINTFHNKINDLITLANVGDYYTYVNIGKFQSLGLSSKLNIEFKKIDLEFDYVVNGRNSFLSNNNIENTYKYSHNLNVSANYYYKKSSVNLFYSKIGQYQSLYLNSDNSLSNNTIKGYSILDFNFSKNIIDEKIKIVLSLKNILNIDNVDFNGQSSGVHQSSFNSIPVGYGRSFAITCKFNML